MKGCVLRHIDRDISGMKVHGTAISSGVDVGLDGIYVCVVCPVCVCVCTCTVYPGTVYLCTYVH